MTDEPTPPPRRRRSKEKGYCRVVAMGRLTRDPTRLRLRFNPRVPAARFTLVIPDWFRPKDRPDEIIDRPAFVTCQAYAHNAELMLRWCHRGDPVLVTGPMRCDRWIDKVTGERRMRHYLYAREIHFLLKERRWTKREYDEHGDMPAMPPRVPTALPTDLAKPPEPSLGPADDPVPY